MSAYVVRMDRLMNRWLQGRTLLLRKLGWPPLDAFEEAIREWREQELLSLKEADNAGLV